MLNFHTVNLYGVRIILLCSKSHNKLDKFTLTIPNKKLSKNNKIAFLIVNNYFEKFIEQNIEFLYDKIKRVVNIRGIGHDENIKNIIIGLMEKYFKKYFLESEIDIMCAIEREKSPFYPSNYCDSKISYLAS